MSLPEKMVFGLTVTQLDELQRQARIATSTIDTFTIQGAADLDDESRTTIAILAFQAAHAVRAILRDIGSQRLEAL